MPGAVPRRVVRWAVVAVVAAGLVGVGRVTTGLAPQGTAAYQSGQRDGFDAGYLEGLQDGVGAGRREGRALQAGDSAPAASRQSVQDAFTNAYAAGANDVFSGYDGGWSLGAPYLITLEKATAPVAYRIGSRTPLLPGVGYVLCPNGRDVCQEARR